jgi:autotransporter strand-loop-strand O-heptosyltransferase
MEIALWIDTPALGDTIAAIPTLRKLSEAYNNEPITVFTTKPFLFEGHPLVKQAFKSDADKSDYIIHRTFSPLVGKQYDQHGTKIEFRYSNMDFRQFHAVSLGFTLKESEMEMDLYIERPRELPVKDYVIIHPTHTWPTRTWEQEKWQELIDRLNERGIPVVAVGRDSKEVGFFNIQKPVMPINIKLGVNLLNDDDNDPAELRWMMNHRARAVVTMDSGMLHIAGTTDVNIVQLGSSIDNKLRAPYRGPDTTQDYKYYYVNGGCSVFCSSNMKSNVQVHGSINGVPPQVKCLEDRPTFECHPSVDQVFEATIKLYDMQPIPENIERAYITHTTENYEQVTINLVNSILAFSKYPIVVYTIDYTASETLQSIATCIRLDLGLPELTDSDFHDKTDDGIMYVNRETHRTYKTLSAKIDCMLDACNFTKEWVYLDSDCIANYNVDDLFDWCGDATIFPLATLGPQDYVLLVKNGELIGNPFIDETGNELTKDNKKCLEWPLMDYFGMDVSLRSNQYRTTNILVGSNNNKEFLNTWRQHKETLPTKVDAAKFMPFHEETIYNVLVWGIENKGLEMVYVNVEGPETVNHFFNTNTDSDKIISRFYKLPKDKEKIKVFHGEKRELEANLIINRIKKYLKSNDKKKLVFLAPHLSTGGMPEFLFKRIEALNDLDEFEVHVIEYCLYATTYVVQRDKIKSILGDRFHEIAHLGDLKQDLREARLIELLETINPDIIHIEETPESFDSFNQLSFETQQSIYSADRSWRIAETCHNIWFQPNENKRIFPDAFALVSPEHAINTFATTPSIKKEIYFPIIEHRVSELRRKKCLENFGFDPEAHQYHLVNIGLWTPGKNQGEAIQWARALEAQDAGKFQFHFVGNQASNFESYWGPLMENLPANCHIWGERSDVDTFYQFADAIVFNSTWECNPLTVRQSLGYPIPVIARNLPQYRDIYKDQIIEITPDFSENIERIINALQSDRPLPVNEGVDYFKQQHIELYNTMLMTPIRRELNKQKSDWTIEWINGPKVTSNVGRDLQVDFILDDVVVYSNTLKGKGHWCKPSIEYWADWVVKIDGEDISLDHSAPTIIQFDSSSLGDSLSWVEPCVEFKKKWGIEKLFIATHKNWLFDKVHYAEMGIEFIAPGEWPEGAEQRWHTGVYMEDIPGKVWFPEKNKRDWRKIYLGDIASDCLGIGQVMRAPKLVYTGKWEQTQPYICIATASTAQAKYWNNPTGWQSLIDSYKKKGYDVYHVSKEKHDLKGLKKAPGDLADVYRLLQGAEMFYGISSGLSWFAWATDVPVVLISGFTPEICEFDDDKTLRIINKQVCNSCWLDEHFDRGDWNWCPRHKGTERMFECTKEITAESVIEQVENWKLNK